MNNFKYKINLYNEIVKNIAYNYDSKHLNYQILQNIKEILDFKKNMIKDIMKIINENDIDKRIKRIMDLNYKMDNIN